MFRERWYTADFDQLDWRDVRVHGFRIVEGARGDAELQLDVDFLLARSEAGFRVAQTMLQFHDVSGLRLSLDYVACSAGMTAFVIDRIERTPLRDVGDAAGDAPGDFGPWRWRIAIAWPEGFLDFDATGFSQWLVGEPIEQDAPSLAPADRL
ncbi:MAG: hypothetical protein ACOY82_02975 [Pseudomonadota bacterium]